MAKRLLLRGWKIGTAAAGSSNESGSCGLWFMSQLRLPSYCVPHAVPVPQHIAERLLVPGDVIRPCNTKVHLHARG